MSRVNRSGALALILSVIAVSPVLAQGASQKFAFINSQTILERAPGRSEADSLFNKEMTSYRAQVQKMGDSLNTMMANYDKTQATLTAAQRDARQKELRQKQDEYQQKVAQLEQQAQQRQYELAQPMMDQIRKVLDEIRTEDGYSMIFDVAAQGGPIVAVDKNLDITEKVISRLKPVKPVAAGAAKSDSAAKPGGATRPAPAGATRPRPPEQ